MVQMTVGDMALKVALLLQVGAGVLGNAYLLFLHGSLCSSGHRQKTADLVLSNLAMANSFVLLSKGTQQIMEDLGLTSVLEGSGCQVFYYLHRVSREVLLCVTCLLSCFQSVVVSPRSGLWLVLRHKISKHAGSSCFLCWTPNLAINIISPIQIRVAWENSSDFVTRNSIVCQLQATKSGMYSIPLSFMGALLMTLMVVASVHMVCVLLRHHQKVQHIHSPSVAHRTSPEVWATYSSLLLVASFIPFYFLNSIYVFYDTKSFSSYLWLQHTLKFLATCFPTLSPLALVLKNSRALGSCF
uniref:vomeronasal type-1 receptor 1-like n=1 Tax=Jaculus jaculus TaxID=51337 RepID=UPI001E1B2D5C|nr:vomeronasal type-1 receptor 1-like [Jaculus jaculus]